MSTGWRFALSRRWFGYVAFAIAFAIACGLLANWQLARSKEAAAANALISANFAAQPLPIRDVVPDTKSFSSSDQWRPVTVSGEYLVDEQFVVRNRPFNGSPGFEVLTPLRQADGSIFVIDRGWVPVGDRSAPVTIPAPPSGTVTVTARLKPQEPTIAGQTTEGRQLATIRLDEIAQRVTGEVYTGAYGVMISEQPAPPAAPERLLVTPPLRDEGLHWSYMVQWIIFALIGFFGLGYAFRVEYRRHNETETERSERERVKVSRKRRRSDADIEDDILDRAGTR